jgi:aminoglycoside 3-N-acetyltransferase
MDSSTNLVTYDRLVRDLRSLGLAEGQIVFFHVSLKAVGWVVGGPDQVIRALLDVLTPSGTLGMYISWEEWERSLVLYQDFNEEQQQIYRETCPPFDPAASRANREWSILAEYLRTWPGSCRSDHPTASVCAVGAQAEWITANQPLAYGYGHGSPWEKLCQAGGKYLLLGSPLESVTLFHYAEHICKIPQKNIVRNQAPLLREGRLEWVQFEEFDTTWGIRDRESSEYFQTIMQEYLAAGNGRSGIVGNAQSYLLDSAHLAGYAVRWMERTWKE